MSLKLTRSTISNLTLVLAIVLAAISLTVTISRPGPNTIDPCVKTNGPQGPVGISRLTYQFGSSGLNAVIFQSAVVSCPVGTKLIGGGAAASQGALVVSVPRPTRNEWDATAQLINIQDPSPWLVNV